MALAGAAALLVAGASLAVRDFDKGLDDGIGKKAAGQKGFDLAVAVEPAALGQVSVRAKGSGRIRPSETVQVTAATSGKTLRKVFARQGESLAAGDLIAAVDDRALSAAVVQAQAALRSAEAAAEHAGAALERTSRLTATGAATRQALGDARAADESAQAALEQAKAGLRIATVELEAASVTAPVAGTVIADPLPEGTLLSAGAVVATLARDGRMELAAEMPERDLRPVSPGQSAEVKGLDGRIVKGKVASVDFSVGQDSRLGTVRIGLPPDSGLAPGMFASAAIDCGQRQVLTVPASAVSYRNGKPVVFVVRDGQAFMRAIGAGTRDGGRVEVTDGLASGEYVVVRGGGLLNDGNMVKVVAPEAGR